MRSAAIDPLAMVSMATMPKRPLLGASVATQTTGIPAREARRIQDRRTWGRLGKVMIPSTFSRMAARTSSQNDVVPWRVFTEIRRFFLEDRYLAAKFGRYPRALAICKTLS